MNPAETFAVTYLLLVAAFYAGVALVLFLQRRRARRHAAWVAREQRRNREHWDAFYGALGDQLADEAQAYLEQQDRRHQR